MVFELRQISLDHYHSDDEIESKTRLENLPSDRRRNVFEEISSIDFKTNKRAWQAHGETLWCAGGEWKWCQHVSLFLRLRKQYFKATPLLNSIIRSANHEPNCRTHPHRLPWLCCVRVIIKFHIYLNQKISVEWLLSGEAVCMSSGQKESSNGNQDGNRIDAAQMPEYISEECLAKYWLWKLY